MTKYVRDERDLEALLRSEEVKTVVLDFYAHWCAPCKVIAPKLEEFTMLYPCIQTLSVNVDECMELVEKYNVSVMPTFKVIKDGKVVETVIGSNLEVIEAMYKKYNMEMGSQTMEIGTDDNEHEAMSEGIPALN